MRYKTQISNKPEYKKDRKRLRNNSTAAEKELWKHLKGRKLEGRKFRRQHSIYHFILDFYCPLEKLAIELDGAHHCTKEGQEADKARAEIIEAEGITIIRFENYHIFEHLEEVLGEIRQHFKS